MLINAESEVGAENKRKLCFAYTDTNSGLEILQGMVDKLMQKLRVIFRETSTSNKTHQMLYHIERSNNETFFEDRQAHIYLNGVNIGIFGIIHPKILKHFGIKTPVSLAEIDIEYIFEHIIKGELLQAEY